MPSLALRLPVIIGSILVLLGSNACARADVIPISSSLQLTARSDVGLGDVIDTQGFQQTGAVDPLSVAVSALATQGAGSLLVSGSATATWNGPAQGQVSFTNLGWTAQNITAGDADLRDFTLLRDWSYTFTADVTGLFTLDYSIVATTPGSTFGLTGFHFWWDGDRVTLPVNTEGTLARPVTAGSTHTVQLGNQANFSGFILSPDARMNGTFDFTIPTGGPVVPEPSGLALVAAGAFGLLGYRRFRTAPRP